MATETTDPYIAAGHLLVFSTGEYSDYTYAGVFVTLEPLYRSALQELRDQVNSDYDREEAELEAAYEVWNNIRKAAVSGTDVGMAPPSWMGSDKREFFIAAMIRKGWLLAITYTELHTGSYGDLDLRF